MAPRTDPPTAGGERETIEAFLDYHRDTLLMKVDGLSDEDLRRVMVPSGVSILGLVKHLAHVERWWFRRTFLDEPVERPWTEDDPDADFRIEPHETTAEILDLYRGAVDESRAACAAASLEDAARRPERSHYTLRWILLHMLEETARHNGHADIFRETIDGVTGE